MYKSLMLLTLTLLSTTAQQDDKSLGLLSEPGLLPGPDVLVTPPPTPDPNSENTYRHVVSCSLEGEIGECVPFYLCNDNSSIQYYNSFGIDNINSGSRKCRSYWDACCPLADRRDPNDPILPNKESQPRREGCGYSNPDGLSIGSQGPWDISGGFKAMFGEFPWVVAILKSESEKNPTYIGEGSLIHPSVVLTTAHSVAALAADILKVRAGEWDTQTTKEFYPYQERNISKTVVHKDYNKKTLYYDIAVVFLAAPMELAPNVGVVCLPPPAETPAGGARCLTAGWGKEQFGSPHQYQVLLDKEEVPAVEHRACQTALRRTRLGRLFMLHSSFLCAGGGGAGTCDGAGGAPLVCPIEFEEHRYMQSGISAWSVGCSGDAPGVYVNVARLRDWIDDKVKGQGYETTGYSYTI